MSSLTATIDQAMTSPFPGGAPDQFMTKALPTARASERHKDATFMGWRLERPRSSSPARP